MQLFSFLKKEFVKNVFTLISGSAISQIIVYASVLLLTRLYSTEVFGIYAIFSSSILILKPIVSLQYELAVVIPKNEKDAANILVFSSIIIFISNCLLLLIICLLKDFILDFFEINELSFFLYFIPLSTFIFGLITSLNYWNNRVNKFKNIATGNIIKSSTMSSAQIITGFSFFNNIGLIPGMIFGQFLQLLFLIKKSTKSLLNHKKEISVKRMILLAKKYKDIPVFNTLISFLNTLSNEIPVFMISKYFGLSPAGIYGLAIKVGKAPSGIIQNSVSQVFFSKASKIYNEGSSIKQTFEKTLFNLLKIASLIFIPFFILSFFFDILFGEEWSEIGIYIRILIPWLFVMLLSSPLTSLIVILNKQKVILFYDILLLAFRFASFYIGYHFYNDILISLALFSGVGVVFNFFILIYFFKISKNKTINTTAYK